jgi:hypothetical protein
VHSELFWGGCSIVLTLSPNPVLCVQGLKKIIEEEIKREVVNGIGGDAAILLEHCPFWPPTHTHTHLLCVLMPTINDYTLEALAVAQ